MNKKLLLCVVMLFLSSCASVASGRTQNVAVYTGGVENAKCHLWNNKGSWYVQQTPGNVTINTSYKDLQISCEKEGYKNGKKHVLSFSKSWVFGNIFFLPFAPIGAIIDIGNGSAYQYPQEINIVMNSGDVTEK